MGSGASEISVSFVCEPRLPPRLVSSRPSRKTREEEGEGGNWALAVSLAMQSEARPSVSQGCIFSYYARAIHPCVDRDRPRL